MFTKRLSWGVGILCVGILGCILVMAIRQAQIAADKVSSGNNLKQLVLGLQNYESVFKRLPSGCDQEAKHGWQTHLRPYMEANDWYGKLDMQYGWEHPFNSYLFGWRMVGYLRDDVESKYSSEGHGLTHYLGNPCILHRGSNLRFTDIDAGLSNVWFVGEIGSRYPPFGYPFNWRAFTWPLNSKDGGFGGWSDGAQFGMGDMAIRFVSSSVDPSVVEQLANAMAKPDSERTRIPDRQFQCGGVEYARTSKGFQNEEVRNRPKLSEEHSAVYFDLDRRPEVLVWRGKPGFAKLGITIESMLSEYSEARVLDYGADLDLVVADKISRCENLEALKVGSIAAPDQWIEILKSMQRLKYLAGKFDTELLEQLRRDLPDCEVSTTKYLVPK